MSYINEYWEAREELKAITDDLKALKGVKLHEVKKQAENVKQEALNELSSYEDVAKARFEVERVEHEIETKEKRKREIENNADVLHLKAKKEALEGNKKNQEVIKNQIVQKFDEIAKLCEESERLTRVAMKESGSKGSDYSTFKAVPNANQLVPLNWMDAQKRKA